MLNHFYKIKVRVSLWLRIFRYFRSLSFKGYINLFLSSFYDFIYCIVTSGKYNPKLIYSGIYYVKQPGFYIFVREKSDDFYNVIPGREYDVESFIINILEDGDVFLDVGANIGYYTILGSRKVGDKGRVIAIEPILSTSKVLTTNIKLNKLTNVTIYPYAASNKNGFLYFKIPSGLYGQASAISDKENKSLMKVRTLRLDNICNAYNMIKLIKIDVEGHELEVLMGSMKTLAKTKYIILEISRNKNKVLKLLASREYKIKKLMFTTHILAINKKFYHSSKGLEYGK